MRITIHGSYGTGNRGDNVILIQLLRFLEQECPEAEICILCRDERRLSLFLDTEFAGSSLRLSALHASFKRRPLQTLAACLHCDLFILGGGGLLWGRAPGNLSYWLLRPRLAKWARCRLVFYVPGIYNIKGRRALRMLGRLAIKADFLSVRDEEGLHQLVRAGIPESRVILGADPAFLLPPPEAERSQDLIHALGLEGQRLVGLSARDWRGRLSAGLFARFVKRILENEGCSLLFFALKSGGLLEETDRDDLAVAQRLLQTLPEDMQERVLVVDENYSIPELLALLSACDYLIGMRLHALIFATIAGIPFGAVSYDEKISAYMRMLHREPYLMNMTEAAVPERLHDLGKILAEERSRSGSSGPLPPIYHAAAQLSVQSLTMHRELAAKLQAWFPTSRNSASPPEDRA